jgi:hypothetical protein
MSEYGRLYAKAEDLRRELKALLPGRLTGSYTPEDARRLAREQAAALVARVDGLADRWAALEDEMKRTPG